MTFYKKIKFRENGNYTQSLQQLIIGGRMNTLKRIVIFGEFLFCGLYFAIHFWVVVRNKAEENDPVKTALSGNILIGTLMTFACSLPFFESRALRFGSFLKRKLSNHFNFREFTRKRSTNVYTNMVMFRTQMYRYKNRRIDPEQGQEETIRATENISKIHSIIINVRSFSGNMEDVEDITHSETL